MSGVFVGRRFPIVQYWDAGEPPDYLAERLATFRDRNPEMEHLLFDERMAEDFIAEHFGEREASAFRACAVPTMQSDYFRYCAVHVLGGVYVDVGFRCVAPLRPLIEGADGGVLFKKDPPGFLFSGFFLFSEARHPLHRLVLDVATANIERRVAERVQMVTGPWILSSLHLLHRLGSRYDFRHAVKSKGLAALTEVFCDEAEAIAPTAGARRWIRSMIPPLFAAVREYSCIEEAFRHVQIASHEVMSEYVAAPDSPLPYKQSDRYWLNWQRHRSIFR